MSVAQSLGISKEVPDLMAWDNDVAGGPAKSVPNTFPWSNTRWANFNEKNQTFNLSHHDSRLGPNTVLELPDSDKNNPTMDSDKFLNHPGLFGITWNPKKAEAERLAAVRAEVAQKYPVTGSCAVLSNSLDNITAELIRWQYNSNTKDRVKTRYLTALSERKSILESNRTAACVAEAEFQRSQERLLDRLNQPEPIVNSTNILLSVLILMGAFYILKKMKIN